jgi:sarcosine oxidase delta subunit
MKCRIQWINDDGERTPDTNDAVGYAWIEAYYQQPSDTLPYGLQHEESEHYPICRSHLEVMRRERFAHWIFEPFTDEQIECPYCGGRGDEAWFTNHSHTASTDGKCPF